MFSRKVSLPMRAAAFVAMLSLPVVAHAQGVPDQPTWFTFGNEVALPGVKLPPGQYEFKQASNKGDREIIEVYNRADGKRVATLMAVGTKRSDAQPMPEKAEVRFFEVPAGTPPAVQSWWYPGTRSGHEFIYPKDEAQKLVALNKEGVLTAEGDAESGKVARMMSAAEASAPPEPSGAQAVVQPAPREPEAGGPPAREPAVAVERPAPTPTPTPAPAMARAQSPEPAAARTELPRTATEAPLLLAIGFGAFFAGLALVVRRRRA